MPTLTIHDLSDEVMDRLRKLATENNRSKEEEARDILERHFATRIGVLSDLKELWTEISSPAYAEDVDDWTREHRPEQA